MKEMNREIFFNTKLQESKIDFEIEHIEFYKYETWEITLAVKDYEDYEEFEYTYSFATSDINDNYFIDTLESKIEEYAFRNIDIERSEEQNKKIDKILNISYENGFLFTNDYDSYLYEYCSSDAGYRYKEFKKFYTYNNFSLSRYEIEKALIDFIDFLERDNLKEPNELKALEELKDLIKEL